jgi:hypothetical protein
MEKKMKITNEELKQIIKEELEIVLNEAFGLPHMSLGPAGGAIYKGFNRKRKRKPVVDDKVDLTNIANTRQAERDSQRAEEEQERLAQSQAGGDARNLYYKNKSDYPTMIAAELSNRYRIPANPNKNGGINVKHGGETLTFTPNPDLGPQEAIEDIINQLDQSVRRKGSQRRMKRGEETINIADPMMENNK